MIKSFFYLIAHVAASVTSSRFSIAEQQEIVDHHNFLRAQVKPSAGNMEKMVSTVVLRNKESCWDVYIRHFPAKLSLLF